jgi:hypothetical protein
MSDLNLFKALFEMLIIGKMKEFKPVKQFKNNNK